MGLVIKLSEDSIAAPFQKYKGTVSCVMRHTFSSTSHQIDLMKFTLLIPLSAHFYLIESVLIAPTLLT